MEKPSEGLGSRGLGTSCSGSSTNQNWERLRSFLLILRLPQLGEAEIWKFCEH